MSFEEINKNLEQDDDTNPRRVTWLISLIDLISLIFAFFVLMYSTREIPQEKYEEIKNSFTTYTSGEKPKKIYNFTEKSSGKVTIVKKASDISYLEAVFKNSLTGYPDIKILAGSHNRNISLIMEKNYSDINELSAMLNSEFLAISKIVNPTTNQIQIVSQAHDLRSSLIASDLISKKLEEFGYEKNIQKTLPDEFITEKVEKEKNTVRIILLINSYENIF